MTHTSSFPGIRTKQAGMQTCRQNMQIWCAITIRVRVGYYPTIPYHTLPYRTARYVFSDARLPTAKRLSSHSFILLSVVYSNRRLGFCMDMDMDMDMGKGRREGRGRARCIPHLDWNIWTGTGHAEREVRTTRTCARCTLQRERMDDGGGWGSMYVCI
jgi:hypothetical protein